MKQEIRTVFWNDGTVVMIDQKALPLAERYLTCTNYQAVISAIKNLNIRGAPAIGVAAAMGIALGTLQIKAIDRPTFRNAFIEICGLFAAARPTARNLFWAIERMRRCFDETLARFPEKNHNSGIKAPPGRALPQCFSADGRAYRRFITHKKNPVSAEKGPEAGNIGTSEALPDTGLAGEDDAQQIIREAMIAEAIRICDEDIEINIRLSLNGRELIPDNARILTHCNAGALATAGYGTALGVIRAAKEEGKNLHVYVDETRPVLQGARLTAWEMIREGIRCTLITDNMAGFLMKRGEIDLVIVGADRIAANGDTANKIGTYALAVLAKSHGIPFYIAAPLSTIDPSLPNGDAIPIEERGPEEVTYCGTFRIAPENIAVWNPAFDVTPHNLLSAIITEAGMIGPPFSAGIRRFCAI